jgi:T-complex protein 1 subunit delta
MDKMITTKTGEVVITNDGATILELMDVQAPAAKMVRCVLLSARTSLAPDCAAPQPYCVQYNFMRVSALFSFVTLTRPFAPSLFLLTNYLFSPPLQLSDLSKSQDIEAGDGTTSVVVLAGSLLSQCQGLLHKGIHPSQIADGFKLCEAEAQKVLQGMSIPVDLADLDLLQRCASTCLNSKVVSQSSTLLAPMAVQAVLAVADLEKSNVDLRDVRIVKKLGGTVDDSELVDGLVFNQRVSHAAGGPTKVKDAKVGLIQFCLSAPKTDMENQIQVHAHQQMDRLIREEKLYIANLVKTIKKAGCTVLLIQKSILRDAYNDLSLHFCAKAGIMVIKDIERDEVEFIAKTLNLQPVADITGFKPDKLGSAGLVEETSTAEGRVTKVTDVPNRGRTVSILLRGSNKLMLDELDRSLHDALCVVRCLVKRKFLISGGSSGETEVSTQLFKKSLEHQGAVHFCMRAYAEAREIVPYTLAENAGLHPITVVTELRNHHAENNPYAGINVMKGCISDMKE